MTQNSKATRTPNRIRTTKSQKGFFVKWCPPLFRIINNGRFLFISHTLEGNVMKVGWGSLCGVWGHFTGGKVWGGAVGKFTEITNNLFYKEWEMWLPPLGDRMEGGGGCFWTEYWMFWASCCVCLRSKERIEVMRAFLKWSG